jgi:hypothetical protein
MSKNVLVGLVLALGLVVVVTMFQWRYDEFVQDTGSISRTVKMRTNRFSGTAQMFDQHRGWTTVGGATSESAPATPVMASVAQVEPQAAPTPMPCPTPDPNNRYWYFSAPSHCN